MVQQLQVNLAEPLVEAPRAERSQQLPSVPQPIETATFVVGLGGAVMSCFGLCYGLLLAAHGSDLVLWLAGAFGVTWASAFGVLLFALVGERDRAISHAR